MNCSLKLCMNMYATNLCSLQRQRCFHYLKSSINISVNSRMFNSPIPSPRLILNANSGACSHLGLKFIRYITKFSSSETDSSKIPLSKQQAHELVLKLTEEEQKILLTAIQTFQSEKMRQEFQGKMIWVKYLCFYNLEKEEGLFNSTAVHRGEG